MVYKYFNRAIVFRTILVVFVSIAGTLAYLQSLWFYLGLSILAILIIIVNTIYYFNAVNRKLSFFFDAVRNEDSTLHFPDHIKHPFVKSLHQSLNNLNEILSEIKIKSEHKERFFMEFMKRSSTGLIAVDEKGYIEIINDTALRIFGAGILVHIERLRQVNKDFYEVMTTLKPNQSKTIKALIREELHIIQIKMVALKFGNQNFNIFSLSDIKNELDEREMDAWQKLIRILTHEIMNSIAPISSISSTLSNYFKDGKKVTKHELNNMQHGLEVISERSKGLTHFVDNYRKMTKVPKPVFKKVLINDWMESCRILFEERAVKESIQLEILNSFEGESFFGDQKLLTQVALNLFNNAADAMSNNKEKSLKVVVAGKEENLSIRFIDNGPGIKPEDMDQIFIPFFTTKENGSGIGLSLSRQILRMHKGQLTARSIPGKETVFEMRI
ncbi:MAG: PAS domain-containing sensor histidine kinase [Bacteroidota bacterium]